MNEMKSICIDARMLNSAGIGSVIRTVLKGFFQNSSYKLFLLTKESEKEEAFFSEIKEKTIIPIKSSIYSLKEQWELYLKIPHCDLFWSPHFNVPALPIKAKKRVVTIHDCYHLAFQKKLSFLQKFYAQTFYNLAVAHADKLITDSSFSKSQIEKHCYFKKECTVIHAAVDKNFKRSSFDEIARITKKYHLTDDFLLAVGNIKPHKNLGNLIKAFEFIKKKKKSLQLLLIGKKDGLIQEDKSLFSLINEHPNKEDIRFLGFVPHEDLVAFYSKAKLFVFPSLYEGFGLPPLEAMACECPVVASQCASIPEICQDAVSYIEPNNIYHLSEAICSLLDDDKKAKSLVDKGLKQFQLFSEEKCIKSYFNLFHELMSVS